MSNLKTKNQPTRKTEKMPGFPGIYRIFNFDPDKKKWIEPERGKKFGVQFAYTQNGKRIVNRQLFETFHEAKAFWVKTRSGEIENHLFDTHSAETSEGMKFSELLDEFKRYEVPTKATSTQIKYHSFMLHFSPLLHLTVERIRPTDIDKLIATWRSPEYLKRGKPNRCNYDHEFTLLRSVFKFYVDRYNRNYQLPFIHSHTRAIVIREKPFVKKDMTLDEYELFLEKLGQICLNTKAEKFYYLAQVQYGIYGRIQEAAALNFEDFDFKKGRVRIDKKVVWLRRKGMKAYIERGSKTNSGREIVMTTQLEQVCREWMLRSGRREGSMFNYDDEVISFRSIQHYYNRAFKDAGLKVRGTHVMRHASLSEAYEASHDILAVQALAGHRDLKTTSRYAKTRDKALQAAVEKLSERMSQHKTGGTQKNANR